MHWSRVISESAGGVSCKGGDLEEGGFSGEVEGFWAEVCDLFCGFGFGLRAEEDGLKSFGG